MHYVLCVFVDYWMQNIRENPCIQPFSTIAKSIQIIWKMGLFFCCCCCSWFVEFLFRTKSVGFSENSHFQFCTANEWKDRTKKKSISLPCSVEAMVISSFQYLKEISVKIWFINTHRLSVHIRGSSLHWTNYPIFKYTQRHTHTLTQIQNWNGIHPIECCRTKTFLPKCQCRMDREKWENKRQKCKQNKTKKKTERRKPSENGKTPEPKIITMITIRKTEEQSQSYCYVVIMWHLSVVNLSHLLPFSLSTLTI